MAVGQEEAFMKGNVDQERRRAKRKGPNWAKCLVGPTSVQVLFAAFVGITNVIAALVKLYNTLRD